MTIASCGHHCDEPISVQRKGFEVDASVGLFRCVWLAVVCEPCAAEWRASPTYLQDWAAGNAWLAEDLR
jgi:hypothetical protein